MFMRVLARVLLIALAVAVVACGGGWQSHPEGGAPAAAPAPPPVPIGASTITGTVKLEGTPPEARVIAMSSDPLCMPEGPTISEVVLVGPDNGLQNVFVYVKDGLGDRTFTAPQEPVVLNQSGCRYMPHVFGAQVGQPVKTGLTPASPTGGKKGRISSAKFESTGQSSAMPGGASSRA